MSNIETLEDLLAAVPLGPWTATDTPNGMTVTDGVNVVLENVPIPIARLLLFLVNDLELDGLDDSLQDEIYDLEDKLSGMEEERDDALREAEAAEEDVVSFKKTLADLEGDLEHAENSVSEVLRTLRDIIDN